MPELSSAARLAWQVASYEAAHARHPAIEREHLLIGVLSLHKTLGFLRFVNREGIPLPEIQAEADAVEEGFLAMGITGTMVRRGVRSRLRPGHVRHADQAVHSSEACRAVVEAARDLAAKAGDKKVTVRHLLASILDDPGPIISAVLTGAGIPPCVLRKGALEEIAGKAGGEKEPEEKGEKEPEKKGEKQPRRDSVPPAPPRAEEEEGLPKGSARRSPAEAGGAAAATQEPVNAETPLLDRYGRDMTRAAREGRLLPFVDTERTRNTLRQLVKVLMMPAKNNPVLVGEAGVGKTAIVEALAERIALGRDRHLYSIRRVVELSMAELVAGTKYRGEFEERLTRVIDEVRSHPDIVLFIDEFHTVVGAGRAEGAPMDAGNIMKPALARGELRCIGATTVAEYRKSIEKDPALERRFQPVQVAEPDRNETVRILLGLRAHRESHFAVTVTDDAVAAAVDLAVRFDPGHALPDKAIDLLDRACAECRVPILAFALDGEAPLPSGGSVVRPDTVARAVSEKFLVPLEVVLGGLGGLTESRIRGLEEHLNRHIVGQEAALSRVGRRLLLAHAGLGDRRRPLGVFLFLGPSGVGKTEVARQMASYLFGDSKAFIRLDMSEYQDNTSVSRLIGASPGYVGYEEGGQLTERLRTTPYAVVLLDEVDKAAPRVFDLFLQLFDDGKITDGQGRTADARNAIFVMTGNVPAEKGIGFLAGDRKAVAEAALEQARRRFRPEFLNRIDEQIVFRPLGRDDVAKVLEMNLAALAESLFGNSGVVLEVSPEAREWLAREGYSPEYGVRELGRVVDRYVRGPISALGADGRLKAYASRKEPLVVRLEGEKVVVG